MNLNSIEGFIEVEGKHPILITALHGFGTDTYRLLVKILRRYINVIAYVKTSDFHSELRNILMYSSAVDAYTWEIAYKIAVGEEVWCILPTLSKVDKLNDIGLPDYNLNKGYAIATPFWKRVREIVNAKEVKVIIDIHGMKNVKNWPDICISTKGFTSASKKLANILSSYFRKQGLNVAIDYPFVGGTFIAEFGKPPNIEAIAIEIKKNLRFYGSKIPEIMRGAVRIVKRYVEDSMITH